ncbi:protein DETOXIFICATION 21-like [Canna indica]|uniref:Protein DETOXIFICATION n=1 Tax=Canna indica TaxID=4628 RepID=A0AAQ3L551_9LILI|nr:protein DETOXIFICATION 21-like [Canna indica]
MEEEIKERLLRKEEEEKRLIGGEGRPAAEKETDEDEGGLGRKLWVENKKLWVVAGPSIFTRFSTFGVLVITQAFIGHIGATELAAYAIVSTVLMRFANGILLGMASALETLCGQSFGAKQYHMLGVYLQRSWIILFSCSVLLSPVFVFTAPLLKLIGQEESISDMAGVIALWFIPVVFSYVWAFTLQMYLQAQSKNMIITYLAVVTLALHVFLSWFMVIKLELGLPGAMISMIFSMWIPVIGQLAFVFFGGCPDTWTGFSMSAFRDLWSIIKLSLSSGVMLCLELWYYTVLVLLTGYMKNAEVAIDALSICLNINGWEMMISVGFLAAAGVRVANELGAGSAKRAKFSILNVLTISFIIGFVLFIFFLVFRGRLALIFTDDHDVAIAVDNLSSLLAFSILLNSIQPVVSGVAIGAGWQGIVAYVNIACYYVIGIPLGVVLGYVFGFHVKVRSECQMLFSIYPKTITFEVPYNMFEEMANSPLEEKNVNLPWCIASFQCEELQPSHFNMDAGDLDWNAAWNMCPDFSTHAHMLENRLGQTGNSQTNIFSLWIRGVF